MYKKFSIVLVLAVFLIACNKEDVEHHVVEPFDGIIRATVNLSEWRDKAVDIKEYIATVSLIYRANGQESVFATADFVNGGFNMQLPAPPEHYLHKPDHYFDSFKPSDKNAKMFRFGEYHYSGFDWCGNPYQYGHWEMWSGNYEEEPVILEGNDFIIWDCYGNERNGSTFVAYDTKGKVVGYFGFIHKNPDSDFYWMGFHPSFWYSDNDLSFGYKTPQDRIGVNYFISLNKGWNIVIYDMSMTSDVRDYEWRFALDPNYFEN